MVIGVGEKKKGLRKNGFETVTAYLDIKIPGIFLVEFYASYLYLDNALKIEIKEEEEEEDTPKAIF